MEAMKECCHVIIYDPPTNKERLKRIDGLYEAILAQVLWPKKRIRIQRLANVLAQVIAEAIG